MVAFPLDALSPTKRFARRLPPEQLHRLTQSSRSPFRVQGKDPDATTFSMMAIHCVRCASVTGSFLDAYET